MDAKEKLDRLKKLYKLHEERDALQNYFEKLILERDSGAFKNMHGVGEHLYNLHIDEIRIKINQLIYEIQDISSKCTLPEDIKCPHCGFVHKQNWRNPTLRILSLVFQPRYFRSVDVKNGKFLIGDVAESFEPFENIHEPFDNDDYTPPDDDGSYAAVRDFARGQMIFLCDKCLGYFDGSQYRMNMVEEFCDE